MKRFLFIAFLYFSVVARMMAQTAAGERFDNAFSKIYMHTASEDIAAALQSADSLYRSATTNEQKIRSLMLISDMYHRLANRDSSIHYAEAAERIADRTHNHIWQARICGVLSTQHRETGLFREGKRYVRKGLRVIEQVSNPQMVNQFKGQIYQELGFYALDEEQYAQAISYFKRAAPFFTALDDTLVRYVSLAQNDERLGTTYLHLQQVDSAKVHYERAKQSHDTASDAETPIKGFIYNGLGRIYMEEQAYGKADSYLKRALAIAGAAGVPNLQIEVFQSLAQYYHLIGAEETSRCYNEKYLASMRGKVLNNRRYADNVLSRIQQQAATSKRISWVVAVSLVLLVGLATGGHILRQRGNERRYRNMIRKLRSERTSRLADKHPVKESLCDRDKERMPESTKQDLLKKLERFEASQQFTDRHISIAVVAGKMKTNVKYLSYIINNYRNKDFNGYINELRINYIISKMETDSRYLNYKISYLAEECGFATHSQFTTVFKNVTGLSPSAFMTYRRKEHIVV